MTTVQGDLEQRSMLIFIPDISGFSKFVKNTEISHSQHIIEELLEILIASNTVGFKISEIVGDSILFYLDEEIPSGTDLISQIELMYLNFHSHLKMYENSRICQCGACTSTNQLRLKFVLHYGEARFNKIRDHVKLFGSEVILAHRLLKNSIECDEYAIFTENLLESIISKGDIEEASWGKTNWVNETYDVGDVKYLSSELSELNRKVEPPQIEDYGLKGRKTNVLKSEIQINAPLDLTFNVLSDYSIRHYWSDDIKDSDHLNSKITRNGSTHRCLINNNSNDPFFAAHDFDITNNRIIFSETDKKKGISIIHELEKVDETTTLIKTHTLIKSNIFVELFFKLFLKNRFIKSSEILRSRLEVYCQELLRDDMRANSEILTEIRISE